MGCSSILHGGPSELSLAQEYGLFNMCLMFYPCAKQSIFLVSRIGPIAPLLLLVNPSGRSDRKNEKRLM